MARMRSITEAGVHYMHGFYNIQPWDHEGKRVLCQRLPFIDRMPTGQECAEVGVVDPVDGRFEPIAETTAWNFQLGALMHWLGGPLTGAVAYNVRRGDRFVCVVHEPGSGERGVMERPLFALSRDGTRGLGFDLARASAIRPGYAYPGVRYELAGREAPVDEGVYLLDFVGGQTTLILSFAELVERFGIEAMRGQPVILGRVLFNAEGSRFVLSFRFQEPATGKWMTSLVTANLDGSEAHQLLRFEQQPQHFDWWGAAHLLVWCQPTPTSPRGFYCVTDRTSACEPFAHQTLCVDGHCTFSPDGERLATDTFPDKAGNQTLMLYDVATGARRDLAVLPARPSPELKGDLRCDMHPCWDRSGERLLFDAMHRGWREVCVVEDLKAG